jgi:hypothetical protein
MTSDHTARLIARLEGLIVEVRQERSQLAEEHAQVERELQDELAEVERELADLQN